MHFSSLVALAMPLALVSADVSLYNRCSSVIYTKTGNGGTTAINPGSTLTAPFIVGNGQSVFVGTTSSLPHPMELDYNVSGGTIYYDISENNGNPFGSTGFQLNPTGGCQEIHCPANSATCNPGNVYRPNNPATPVYSCPQNNNLLLTLCTG